MAKSTIKVTDKKEMFTFVLVNSYGDTMSENALCNGIFTPTLKERIDNYFDNGYVVKKTVKLYTVKDIYEFPIDTITFPVDYSEYRIEE